MNKWEKEVLGYLLDSEEQTLIDLEKQYKKALNDIGKKVKEFQTEINMLDAALQAEGLDDRAKEVLLSQRRSKVYQKQFQEALQGQISGILDQMQGNNYSTIESYLKQTYEDAYIGTIYDMHGQGIPIIAPIDQAAAVKAVMTDSKISNGLYTALGVDVKKLKKSISAEITRGIASSLPYADIARNLNNVSKAGLSNATRIVRTEGHRIQQASTMDAQRTAKAKGADVVKQWDAALDGRTRPTHRQLDGQIREVDEFFEVAGKKAMAPGYFGDPAEDCNCRCACLTRARWALDEDELQILRDRASYHGLRVADSKEFGHAKAKGFSDFKTKYLNATQRTKTQAASIPPSGNSPSLSSAKDFDELDRFFQNTYNVKIEDNVKSLDFDNVKAALQGIERAFQDFPEIATSVQRVSIRSSGVMSCDGTSVFFNPKHFTDHKTILDACKKNGGGWWVRNCSPASIGYHESAHAFEDVLIHANSVYTTQAARIEAWNKCKEAQLVVGQACKNVKKTPWGKGKKNDELKNSISRYALENPSETMAEAYADVFANGLNASPLSLEIQRLAMEQYKKYKGVTP